MNRFRFIYVHCTVQQYYVLRVQYCIVLYSTVLYCTTHHATHHKIAVAIYNAFITQGNIVSQFRHQTLVRSCDPERPLRNFFVLGCFSAIRLFFDAGTMFSCWNQEKSWYVLLEPSLVRTRQHCSFLTTTRKEIVIWPCVLVCKNNLHAQRRPTTQFVRSYCFGFRSC